MTPENQATEQTQEAPKQNDKEYNFRALEAKARDADRRAQDAERRAQEAEKMAQEYARTKQSRQDDDDEPYTEPYVDDKYLSKKLSKFERRLEEKIEKKSEEKARAMLETERRESWLRQNPDFYDIMQHAETFAQRDPELAETILKMPEGFDRQKLVYKNIKALGIHQPPAKQQSIQEKVDANRKSPYYQPSGVGSAPYAGGGDFSQTGQKQAYAKMQELKSKLRI